MATQPNIIDRAIGALSPAWQLKRERSRAASQVLRRHYEGAASGRRTLGWNRSRGDANAQVGPAASRLRATARDLVRNNPYATAAADTVVDNTIGWGIVAKFANARTQAAWDRWANSTLASSDERMDFSSLQQLIFRAVVVDGEVLVRRRLGKPDEGRRTPLSLQVLEADFIDTSKTTIAGADQGHQIINGVEIDALGRRVAYWLYAQHPGSVTGSAPTSERVPASEILHLYKTDRPGQVRGASWFAPVMVRFQDFSEYEDATLMKQKVAACLAVVTTDPDGSGAPLGQDEDEVDSLEPGMVLNLTSGKTVSVVQPPATNEYDAYSQNMLRAIATGMGIAYEDLTGNYTRLPFSAARMSRIRAWARVHSWRWRILVPQMLDPVAEWVLQAARMAGVIGSEDVDVSWTPPPMPMLEPDKEGLAIMRNIRAGIMTLSEALRERGYDPEKHLAELAADFEKLDALGLVLDCDPRKMTQAGQAQSQSSTQPDASGEGDPPSTSDDGEEEAA